jgi:hypothetical protein
LQTIALEAALYRPQTGYYADLIKYKLLEGMNRAEKGRSKLRHYKEKARDGRIPRPRRWRR